MTKKKNIKSNKSMQLVTLGVIIVLVSSFLFITKNKSDNQEVARSQNSAIDAKVSESGDLIIPVSNITDKASFYDYELDGTKLEVIAIKAPDGSVRTAFNTCQVCYSSGRGYYVQEGDNLVCQNCGNRFTASDVEVTKGGCNPVPISADNKIKDETNITISKSFLENSKVIFENWKL